jgi:hypothetical protein
MLGLKQRVRMKVEINDGVVKRVLMKVEINDGVETTSADEIGNK